MLTVTARRELSSQNGNGRLGTDLTVQKRDGEIAPFDIERIKRALNACMVQDLSYKSNTSSTETKNAGLGTHPKSAKKS